VFNVLQTPSHADNESSFLSRLTRKSQESCASDGDSGVGPDSTGSRLDNFSLTNLKTNYCSESNLIFYAFLFSSRNPSKEGHPHFSEEAFRPVDDSLVHFSWMVEECILAAYDKKCVTCPTHGDFPLAQVAPDTVRMH